VGSGDWTVDDHRRPRRAARLAHRDAAQRRHRPCRGRLLQGNGVDNAEVFDLASQTWLLTAGMLQGRYDYTLTTLAEAPCWLRGAEALAGRRASSRIRWHRLNASIPQGPRRKRRRSRSPCCWRRWQRPISFRDDVNLTGPVRSYAVEWFPRGHRSRTRFSRRSESGTCATCS